jgi:hypothetical protein
VRILSVGGGIAGVQVGREQHYVAFGRGDPTNGEATVNEPTAVSNSADVETQFGVDTPITRNIQDAVNNGANRDFVQGVMCAENVETGVAIDGGSGNLGHVPVEDRSTITVYDDTGTEVDYEFRYDTALGTPGGGAGGVHAYIDPNDGRVSTADDTVTYTVDFTWLSWQNALDAADTVVPPGSSGIYAPQSDSEVVADMLSSKVTGTETNPGIRYPEYRLISGVMGADPNATSSDGYGVFDTANYGDSIDDDAVFLGAPARVPTNDGSKRLAVGHMAGLFAGHAITNSVYGDGLSGITDLVQTVTGPDETNLRDKQVIPINDFSGSNSTVQLEDNLSTSTATDWPRDFHYRRIVDTVISIGREIGRAARSEPNTDDRRDLARQNYLDELDNLVREDLIEPNPDTEEDEGTTKYSVEVTKASAEEIEMVAAFTPIGVTKAVSERIVVSQEQAARAV